MRDFQFHAAGGSSTLFEIIVGGKAVGIVWTRKDRWHAAESSMRDTEIDEATREAAATRFVDRLSQRK